MHEKEPLPKGKTRFRKEAIVSYTPVGIALTTSPAKAITARTHAHTGISFAVALEVHDDIAYFGPEGAYFVSR